MRFLILETNANFIKTFTNNTLTLIVVLGYFEVTVLACLIFRRTLSGSYGWDFSNLEFVANVGIQSKISTNGNVWGGHENRRLGVGLLKTNKQ